MGTDAGLLAKFGHTMRQVVGPLGRWAAGPLGDTAEQTAFLRLSKEHDFIDFTDLIA